MQTMNFLGAWSNTTRYVPANTPYLIGQPVVTNGGAVFVLNGSANPTVGTAPASDSAWTQIGGTSTVNPLNTALTGYSSSPATVSPTDTILQAFNKIAVSTHLCLPITAGNLPAAAQPLPIVDNSANRSEDLSVVSNVITFANTAATRNRRIFFICNLNVTNAAANSFSVNVSAGLSTINNSKGISVSTEVTAIDTICSGMITTSPSDGPATLSFIVASLSGSTPPVINSGNVQLWSVN